MSTTTKRGRGRPCLLDGFDQDMILRMYNQGLTDKQVSQVLGVTEQTIDNWKIRDPKFFEAIKQAKVLSNERVERSLFERATGYEVAEDKIFQHEGIPVIVPTIRKYAPETAACIFWLKNREPDKWRDKHEHVISQPEIVIDDGGEAEQDECATED